MAQRPSGHKRRRHDLYQTPEWVVLDGLAPHLILRGARVWDPCCGPGKMLRAAAKAGATVMGGSDKRKWRGFEFRFLQLDFTEVDACLAIPVGADMLMINPPYGANGELAEDFLDMALVWLKEGLPEYDRTVAVLLPVDFDAGATRARFFEDCPFFTAQITLRRRISWFKAVGAARPSSNHAWYIFTSRWPYLGNRAVKLYAPPSHKWP